MRAKPFLENVTGALFSALCWCIRPFARAFAREAYRELELEFANMAGAIAADVKHELMPHWLERMTGAGAPPFPGEAQPLTEAQRSHLEGMRDKYAPSRQQRAQQPPPGRGVERAKLSDLRRQTPPPETANQP